MKKPEISRISSFDSNDIVQIFGENFDKNTKLYVWYNITDYDSQTIDLARLADFDGPEAAIQYKIDMASKLIVPIAEENINGTIESLLPETPPADAIVFDADDVAGQAIYFGEKKGPQPVKGKYKRVDPVTCVMWLKNAAGFSKPYIANRPEIWNISEDEGCCGEHISVYGINLGAPTKFSDGTHFAKVTCLKNRATGEVIKTDGVEETGYWHNVQKYTADFVIPKGTPDGEYDLFVHSGRCGQFGWSKPVKFTVKNNYSLIDYYRHKWNRIISTEILCPECKRIEISYSADVADYSEVIQSAIDKLASNGGGIVALGHGVFSVSQSIYVKSGVVLLGQGNSTTIKANEAKPFYQDWEKAQFAVCPNGARGWGNDWRTHYLNHKQASLLILQENCGIESLHLELGAGANLGVVIANEKCAVSNNVFVHKTYVDGCCLSELEKDGLYGAICAGLVVGSRTRNFVSWGNTFKTTYAVQVLPSRHEKMVIVNNEINCHPRQMGESMIAGLRNSVVANNTFIGGRRAFVGNGGLSYNWIYQNRITDVSRAGGAEETYMSEFGEGEWNGNALEIGENYITVDGDTLEDVLICGKGDDAQLNLETYNRYLFILNGRGFGQYFRIADVVKAEDGKFNIVIDGKFEVMPDKTTFFTVVFGTHHNLWVDNNTTLSNGHSQFVYDCGFENYIVGHQMEMAAGVYMCSLTHPNFSKEHGKFKDVFAVVAFNTFSDCQTRSSGVGIKFILTLSHEDFKDMAGYDDYNYTGGTFGNCVRNCVLDGAQGQIYVKNLWNWNVEKYPTGIHMSGAFNRMVENKILGYETAIALAGNFEGNCLARNTIIGAKKKLMGQGTPIGEDFRKKIKWPKKLYHDIRDARRVKKAKKLYAKNGQDTNNYLR